MGVGMSRLGASISALEGLLCVSAGDCAAGESWGGGVGCCMGTSGVDSTLMSFAMYSRAAFSSRAVMLRASSGGQVARLAMLSCSTGETIASSGVGIIRWADVGESQAKKGLITHGME